MSILRQLKEEAASKQREAHSQVHLKKQCEQRYEQAILPAMQVILTYMKELVEHLNYLEHTIIVENYSTKYPQIGRLNQKEYSIFTDNFCGFEDINQLKHISIHFLCVGQGVYNYTITSQRLIEQEIHFLNSRNIKFNWECTEIRTGIKTARFTIIPKIPIRFRFEVDFDNSKILLLIDNHEDFRSYKHTFDPEDIDEDLLEEVAKLMLRKKSALSTPKIPENHRETIQKLLEEKRLEESRDNSGYLFTGNYNQKYSPIKKLASLIKKLSAF